MKGRSDEGSSARTLPPEGALRIRIALGVVAVLAIVAMCVLGARIGAMVARRQASRHIRAQEFAQAQRWLARSAWLDSGSYVTDLLNAACYRELNETAAWRSCLDKAVRKGAPRESVALEVSLNDLRSGAPQQGAEAEMTRLIRAGASQSEVMTAFVLGHLAHPAPRSAKALLETMPEQSLSEAHREYLWGVYLHNQEDVAGAEVRLTNALRSQPGHELARAKLAELFEERNDLDQAFREYAELRARAGGSEAASVGLARVLRRRGCLDQARSVLVPPGSKPELGPSARLEMAQIAQEAGRYEEAAGRFDAIGLGETTDEAIVAPAALTFTAQKKPLDAQRLFTRFVEAEHRDLWILELRLRIGGAPERAARAAEELQRLLRDSASPSLDAPGGAPERAATPPGNSSVASAATLYRAHCIACHGTEGDGRGVAARQLFPLPRDLRRGRCQLVSTRNGIPTLEDIERVLALGMPGTAMQPLEDLPEADRRLLAQEVLRLRREGIRDELIRALREEGEEIDESEVRQAVAGSTTPGERVRVPANWPAPGDLAAKGRTTFATLGCVKCHGDDGIGAPDQSLFDDFGEPSRPRDLVHEPLKGGRDADSIYLRIAAGMPGTAHPAALNLPQEQLMELVDYVRSLAQQPEFALTNHERRVRATTPAYLQWVTSASRR
jgi:cytochrome c oxidase cbb3-type subunit 2